MSITIEYRCSKCEAVIAKRNAEKPLTRDKLQAQAAKLREGCAEHPKARIVKVPTGLPPERDADVIAERAREAAQREAEANAAEQAERKPATFPAFLRPRNTEAETEAEDDDVIDVDDPEA